MSTGDRIACSTNEQVVCASSVLGNELTSHLDSGSFGDASCDSSVQGALCTEEGSTVQGRIAREPIDRSRYVVVNGSGGTVFVCSRCSKQYIHRKSLNKHWNDKHADDSSARSKCLTSRMCSFSQPLNNRFNVELVRCPSDTIHMPLSCSSSLVRPTAHSHAGWSPTNSAIPLADSQQKTDSNMQRSRVRHSGTITDSVLWHSLAAVHLNQEHGLNSFYCAPMPAHIGGHYDARVSFLNQLYYDDDCQVLDLSKGSRDSHELSIISVADAPVDLSLKSNSTCLAGGGESIAVHGIAETVGKSAASYHTEVSAADSLILNKPKMADEWVVRFGDSMKDSKPVQFDSVAILRHLHSGVLTNTTNQSVWADSGCRNAVAFVSDELKTNHSKVEPAAKYESSMLFKNNLNVISELPDDLATSKETHDFFGGISRGGHIRCKMCDYSATSILLFSRHVAHHVRKPNVSGDGVLNWCGDGIDKEYGFFMWLGLHRVNGADVDSEQRSTGRCHYAEDDSLNTDGNLKSRCEEVSTDIAELCMPEVQANGVRSPPEGEFGQQKNNSSDTVRQKPDCYQRGMGLTTTESRDAAGRSWRRRRLRTCERCGYVTDNLTTLKRHEVKHGALGMYRCKLCDYTVNQQHILEYHTRNVHRLLKQTGTTNSALCKHNDMPLVDNSIDKPCARTASSLVEDDNQVSWTEDLLETASTGPSAIQEGFAAFSCSSQVAKVHGIRFAVNKYSRLKAMVKNVQYPTSVSLARHHLLDAVVLQLGRGVCVRCGFRSLSSVKMKQHMLQHPHERHVCTLCPHTSLTAHLLLKHKRRHTDCRTGYLAQKKTYPCPECPFLAASPNRLQCHAQFHGVKLRHVCGKCSYSVDRANLIAQHRRLHSSASALMTVQKRRWLHCSKCPFRTINRVILSNHERGHYAINCRYMCGMCSFGTDIANVAFGHQRLHSCIS